MTRKLRMMIDEVLASDDWLPTFGMPKYRAHPAERERFDAKLRRAVCFDISNVYEHVAENELLRKHYSQIIPTGGTETVEQDPEMLVCAPMFPEMWMEFEAPVMQGVPAPDNPSRVVMQHYRNKVASRIGWLLWSDDLTDPRCAERWADMIENGTVPSGTRWLIIATMWQHYRRNPRTGKKVNYTVGPCFQVQLFVAADGTLLKRQLAPYFNRTDWDLDDFSKPDGTDYADAFSKVIPVQFALTFMNCRNVRHEVVTPEPKVARLHRKRTGNELVEYRHLVIDTGKESVVRNGGGGGGHDASRRLHICRGHFRVYTAEKPLFGHYVGPIWVNAHTRGTDEVGIVEKDYTVKAGGPK
jgi:hypothetical protein